MSTVSGPWYTEGLRFRCTQCGNCCTGDPGVVWVDDGEITQIAGVLGKSVGEIRLFHTRLYGGRVSLREHPGGDCTFFDAETRQCRIYSARPKQCRTWPFWKSNLASEATWQTTCQSCPGAGQGDFVSVEEIEANAALIDI